MSTLPMDDPFATQRTRAEQLRQRREAARRLIEQATARMNAPTQYVPGGSTPMFGQSVPMAVKANPLAALVNAATMAYSGYQDKQLEKQETANAEEADVAWRARDDEQRRLALEEALRVEAAKQAALAEGRVYQEGRDRAKHENAIELKGVPSAPQIIQSTSNRTYGPGGISAPSGGSQLVRPNREGTGFAGPATQVGIDPRTNAPVYRHTKSGSLFTYGEDGAPTAHSGLVGPKPTNAQQTAAGEGKMLAGDVDAALTGVEANPDAFGFKTYMPDVALQRVDPKGVAVRAQVGKLSSAQIKDMSGAAVSIHEQKRLNSFLPAAGDDSATVQIKLQNYKDELARKGYTVAIPSGTASGAIKPAKTVKRTGTAKDGRKVIEYSDGTREYK